MCVDFYAESVVRMHRSPSDILYCSEKNASYLYGIITAASLGKSVFGGTHEQHPC